MSEITRNQAIQIVEDIRTAISAGSVTNTMEAQVLEYCVSVLGRRIEEASLSEHIENLPDVAAFLAGISPSTTLKALLEGITEKIPAEASGSNKLADKAFVTSLTTDLQNAVNVINANIGNGYVYAGIATPASTPVNGKVFYLARQAGHYINFGGLTVTEGVNILKRNGSTWTQEQLMSMADIYKNPLIGYYECDTAGNTAAKTVTAAGYVLPATGGSVKIKMANRNTVANATLNINSTGAKPLYYNGQRAGVGNTWDTNEIIEVFYDGAKYQAYNVAGSNGDGVFDISAYNLTDSQPTPYEDLAAALGPNGDNVPLSLRKGGMSVKFIQGTVQSSDKKYIQARCIAQNFTTDVTNWQGVDKEPTTGSKNLTESWGVLSEIQSKEIDVIGVLPVDWFVTSGIPYYGSDGSEIVNTNRRRTNYIKVKEGDAFAYNMSNNDTILIIAAFSNGVLDLTHSVAGAGQAASGTYTVPAGVTHIQFCNNNNHTPVITKTNPTHIDDVPTQNSGKMVKSGGVYSLINTAKSEIEVELAASIVAEDNQLKNFLHTEYVLIDGGIDTETGDETTSTRYKHTALLPVNDRGYLLVSPVILNVAYYSAPFIDSEHYIETRAITEGVPEGSKYCSFIFDTNSFSSFDTLRIIPKEDIDSYLGETCVGISDTYRRNTDYNTLLKHLNLYKYAVKGMYLYGDSVDSSQEYLIRVPFYVASTRSLRLIVSQYVNDGYTVRIDKIVTVPEDKYLDTVLTQDTYNFRIIADFNNVGDLTIEFSANDYFKFNSRVFYPIVNDVKLKGDVEGLAEDISELGNDIDELAENMNNADEIKLNTSDIEVLDYTEYFDPQNGGEVGYFISAATGKKTANTDMTVTGYIPTKGLVGIRTKAVNSGRGLAFYTGNDYSQYTTQYISGAGTNTGADGTSWIPIPSNAKYFRTTVNTSELTSVPPTAILDVQKIVTQTLQEFVDKQDKPTPRNTHVLYGYEGFCVGQKTGNIWFPAGKISSARNTLTQATLDEDVKQIVSENQLMFNKMNYEVTFEVKDVDTYIGIGYYPIAPYVYNELRVRNNNGSAVLEVYGGIGEPEDTYESEDFAVAESVVLPYTLTVGNVYTLGMRRFEDETYNGVDHVDGAIYYIHSYADDVDADSPTEIFMPRDTHYSTGGIKNKTVAAFKGYQFVSLKLGEVEITNMFVSSPYNPHVQAMIIGASFIDGDTVVSQGGQYKKFSCKIQEKIGADSYVIGGRGGDAITSSSFQYLQKEVSLFCPKYLTPYFGTNYTNIDTYISNFEAFTAWLVKIGIEPILVTISPVVDNPTKNAVILAENEWVRNSGFRYVDVYKAVTDGNGNWIEGYVLADGTHPTAAGHQAIYEAFVREVPELFAV